MKADHEQSIKAPRVDDTISAPIRFVAAEETPGWQHLYVLDLETNNFVEHVTKVDCDSGRAWVMPKGLSRSYPITGRFRVVCLPETLARWERVWKSL
jgi:hypothetical protein